LTQSMLIRTFRLHVPLDMPIVQRLQVDEAQSMLVEPSSARDIDLLVTFSADARWGLFEHKRMQNELAGLLGRSVDLISRRAIESSGKMHTLLSDIDKA
jgi:hypothetical protein